MIKQNLRPAQLYSTLGLARLCTAMATKKHLLSRSLGLWPRYLEVSSALSPVNLVPTTLAAAIHHPTVPGDTFGFRLGAATPAMLTGAEKP
jgi:hypothetical protein